jgi:hypothetical protein
MSELPFTGNIVAVTRHSRAGSTLLVKLEVPLPDPVVERLSVESIAAVFAGM